MQDDNQPQTSSDNSALSLRLKQFLEVHCDHDADPKEVAEALARPDKPAYAEWLKDDLSKAIINGVLTHTVLEDLTFIAFDTDEDSDAYLRKIWDMWFPGEPYPTKQFQG